MSSNAWQLVRDRRAEAGRRPVGAPEVGTAGVAHWHLRPPGRCRRVGPPSPTQGILIVASYVTVQATFGPREKIMIGRAGEAGEAFCLAVRREAAERRGVRLRPDASLTEIRG